jgi:hypothetical protein
MIRGGAFAPKDAFAAFSCCQHLRMQEVPVVLLPRVGSSRRASFLDSVSGRQLAILFFNLVLAVNERYFWPCSLYLIVSVGRLVIND